MNRLLHHIGKFNLYGDEVSFEKILQRKKKNGSSLGDMRRLLQRGCFRRGCQLCHYRPVTKSFNKTKGFHKHNRDYLNGIEDL